ncbi:MAG: glutathione S-transferase family protein [Hyphomonadaceae bacterium]|nr:glutathione S-transferase family protein [Hyphomonadaceae bacterium]
MTPVEIIGLPQSNYVWAVRIACAEKGAPHVCVPAPPHSPAVTAIHPFGRIPAMRHGAVTLFESRAICAYVDRAFDGPALVPADAQKAGATEQWTSLLLTVMEPLLIRTYLFGYMFPGTADGGPDRPRIDAALPDVGRHLSLIEGALAGGYLGGDAFTVADAYLTPVLFYLRSTPEAGRLIQQSARLSGYVERQMARAGVRETTPPPPAA